MAWEGRCIFVTEWGVFLMLFAFVLLVVRSDTSNVLRKKHVKDEKIAMQRLNMLYTFRRLGLY